MTPRHRARKIQLFLSTSIAALVTFGHAQAADPDKAVDAIKTASPIKHVIIIVGENRSFDHVFATYVPTNRHESVLNLLSQGIVKADGTPGRNFANNSVHSPVRVRTSVWSHTRKTTCRRARMIAPTNIPGM